jgi:hypothetical protein
MNRSTLNRSIASFATVVALVIAGCGSSSSGSCDGASSGPDGAAGTCGGGGAGGGSVVNCGNGDPIDPTALIDDMEAPDPATAMGHARGAGWWAGGDDASKAAGASIDPDGPVTAEKIPGGRCGSQYANRVTGHGFGTWAVMNVSFGWGPVDGGPDQQLPYDASFRTGVIFWARIGDTSSANVRLNVTDKYSNDNGGICDKTVASGDTACYDHFGVDLTKLSTTWQQYKVPFRALAQLGFGIPRPTVDTTSLYSIDFNLPLGTTFDLWVDDISFY